MSLVSTVNEMLLCLLIILHTVSKYLVAEENAF